MADPSSLTSTPGYQFGLGQGTRGVESGAASRGMLYSGASGKALTRYGQDYAGTKFNEALNRDTAIAGLGQVATDSNTKAGVNAANQTGNYLIGAGNAGAAGSLAQGNYWQNALNQYFAKYKSPGFTYGAADNIGPGE